MIYSLFPIPVGVYTINVPSNIDENFFNSLEDISGNHGLVTKGVSSHDTVKGNQFLLDNEQLIEIKNQIQTCVDEYTKSVGLQPLVITGSWFNIMEPNGEVLAHQHRGSTISGAFYVQSEANTCPFVLTNPYNDFKILDIPSEDTQFNSKEARIDSQTGRLILFPSYIMHRTETNISNSNRIVISFNTLPLQIVQSNKQVDLSSPHSKNSAHQTYSNTTGGKR